MTSHQLFELLLAQTWQVGALALAVWIIVRICGRDRPHLSHCLWGLVLLKCLMPPVWTSPVGLFCWINAQTTQLSTVQRTILWTQSPGQQLMESTSANDVTIRVIDTFDRVAEQSQSQPQQSFATGLERRVSAFEQAKQWAVRVWLIGCIVSFCLAIMRLHLFWRFVQRTAEPHRNTDSNGKIEKLVRRLSQRLQVGRQVRVSLLEASVGPAVYGLIRPTILLPAAIVDGRTQGELEPLVAHELIHVRRGDLWWALVQVLACCLFWFHPLVWLAQAMLRREAEHSCDEETIAGLSCTPAVYAKSLLEVLESKHRLRGAPALPGVRPVDVTRNRLERIMRLGQGCQPSTPTWIWLLFLSSAAICLPGGVWLKAQEGKSKVNQLSATTEQAEPLQSTIPMAPKAKGAWAESWQNARIDICDLLVKLEAQHVDREIAHQILLSHFCQRSFQAVNADGGVTLSQLPAFSIDGDELHVLFETREQIAVVKRAIEELRRCGLNNVRLRFKLLAISAEKLGKLGLQWEAAVEPASDMITKLGQMPTLEEIQIGGGLPAAPAAPNPVHYASATLEMAQPARSVVNENSPTGSIQSSLREFDEAKSGFYEFLQNAEKQLEEPQSPIKPLTEKPEGTQGLLEIDNTKVKKEYPIAAKSIATYCAVIDDKQVSEIANLDVSGTSLLSRPECICRSGSHASMMVYGPWSITPKIASFDRPAPIAPKPRLGFSGYLLTALPVIDSDKDSDTKQSFDLSLAVDFREVTRLDTFTFDGSKANGAESQTDEMTVEQPFVELKRLAARRKLQPGESLLVSSRKPLAPESDGKVLVIMVTCDVEPAGIDFRTIEVLGPMSTDPDVKKSP